LADRNLISEIPKNILNENSLNSRLQTKKVVEQKQGQLLTETNDEMITYLAMSYFVKEKAIPPKTAQVAHGHRKYKSFQVDTRQ
jgi:hypothetical protein